MEIKDVAALVGAITGPMGLLISTLIFFRDGPRVKISLQWDMKEFGHGANPKKSFAIVNIANIGRRPIYLSHAHIKSPLKKDVAMLLTSGIQGVMLAEGSSPHIVQAEQGVQLQAYAPFWWKLRAVIIDTAGKHYYSQWPMKAPSWAEAIKPPFGAIKLNKFRNWLNNL